VSENQLNHMTTPRISASSYSNTAPLIWSFLYGLNHGKFELILDNAPARSAEILAQKRVDCALVPVIEYQRMPDVLLIPNVCVGAADTVRSVCLVTKDIDLKDVKTVSLDESSRTSATLTKIIFREFIGFEPVYRVSKPDLDEMLDESDCALLIGDPSLMIDQSVYRKFDLVETWKSFTGFGFVFAMWMADKDSIEIARNIDFAAIRDEGMAHLDEIIANYETEITLSRSEFKRYLSENIRYSMDDSMQKGMKLFFELANKNGFCKENAELRFLEY
jgi:chorismate dehydratase